MKLKIKRTKVGWRAFTGTMLENRKKIKNPGKVYFEKEMIGQRVVVVPVALIRRMTRYFIILK